MYNRSQSVVTIEGDARDILQSSGVYTIMQQEALANRFKCFNDTHPYAAPPRILGYICHCMQIVLILSF